MIGKLFKLFMFYRVAKIAIPTSQYGKHYVLTNEGIVRVMQVLNLTAHYEAHEFGDQVQVSVTLRGAHGKPEGYGRGVGADAVIAKRRALLQAISPKVKISNNGAYVLAVRNSSGRR